jgi:hypothetical protein
MEVYSSRSNFDMFSRFRSITSHSCPVYPEPLPPTCLFDKDVQFSSRVSEGRIPGRDEERCISRLLEFHVVGLGPIRSGPGVIHVIRRRETVKHCNYSSLSLEKDTISKNHIPFIRIIKQKVLLHREREVGQAKPILVFGSKNVP